MIDNLLKINGFLTLISFLKGGGGPELEIVREAKIDVEVNLDRKPRRVPRMGGDLRFDESLFEFNSLVWLPILPFVRFSALNVRLGHSPRHLAWTASNWGNVMHPDRSVGAKKGITLNMSEKV